MAVAGKVVLITGGAGAIGLAVVQELLKNGAKGVAIVDISVEAGTKALGQLKDFGADKTIFIKTDISNEKEFDEAFRKTVAKFHQLDIVINNAGIIDEIAWERSLQINLVAAIRGTYLAMEKYLPQYKSGDEGIVINTSSTDGLMTTPNLATYSVAKHGLVALGQALGHDEFYDKHKVKVLTVCPGAVKTTMALAGKILFPETFQANAMKIFKSVQTPEDFAERYVEVIGKGTTGSVWVIENNEPPYEILFPDREAMRKE